MNRMKLIFVMIIWGSIGVFTRYIPVSALNLAFLRALIALPVLFVFILKNKFSEKIKWQSYIPYIISGVLLGVGWLTLFYGYKNTNISTAVIIYNMCPVFIMIAAPLVIKEKSSVPQIVIIFISFIGLFLTVVQNLSNGYGYLGMLLSGLSGMIYASIILINRSIKNRVDNQKATFIQILAAMLVLLPFVIFDGQIVNLIYLDFKEIFLIVLLGILHTGIAYTLFFSVYENLKAIEIVAYSYLEPLFGIFFSVLFLNEKLRLLQIIGGILIFGATFVGELVKNKRN